MSLEHQFTNVIKGQNLFQPADRVLLAVSGGVDSVTLCELCYRAGYHFSIAHANFQLRADESEKDEQFVRQIGARYQVPVYVKSFETNEYAGEESVSIQVAARKLRYEWFEELLGAGHRWLLTAHHADDNVETMIMHFFRGTGISGLRGMLPKSGSIVRPLLPFTKEELIQFARHHALVWREDLSNSSDKYSRNHFRNTIIPMIKNIYPGAENNMIENVIRFREAEELYNQAVAIQKDKLIEHKENEIHIPVLKLLKAHPLRTIVFEIIREFNFSPGQLPDVLTVISGEHGKFVRSSTHRIIKNRNWLIIAENEPVSGGFAVIEDAQAKSPNGMITLKSLTSSGPPLSEDPFVAHLDAGKIEYPLILRKWTQGDYFYPLGMKKKKKLARFLIDLKLTPTQKEKVMVLESGKRICWVAGLRIDDRFKITPGTTAILELCFNPQTCK